MLMALMSAVDTLSLVQAESTQELDKRWRKVIEGAKDWFAATN